MPLVVAVSCDATTFARDARILIDGGYKLVTVTPVDQFRYSHHVELVAKFERNNYRASKSKPPPQRSCHSFSPMVQEMRGLSALAGMTLPSG